MINPLRKPFLIVGSTNVVDTDELSLPGMVVVVKRPPAEGGSSCTVTLGSPSGLVERWFVVIWPG
jgi:hypothetical protein